MKIVKLVDEQQDERVRIDVANVLHRDSSNYAEDWKAGKRNLKERNKERERDYKDLWMMNCGMMKTSPSPKVERESEREENTEQMLIHDEKREKKRERERRGEREWKRKDSKGKKRKTEKKKKKKKNDCWENQLQSLSFLSLLFLSLSHVDVTAQPLQHSLGISMLVSDWSVEMERILRSTYMEKLMIQIHS